MTTKENSKTQANSESCQTSKMGRFAKIAKNYKLCTIYAKSSILDVWQDSKYASEVASKYNLRMLHF